MWYRVSYLSRQLCWSNCERHLEWHRWNEADFIAHRYYAANRRTEVIHFDFVMPSKGIVTIISYPKYFVRESVYSIFSVFSVRIWLLILAVFLACGLLNWVNNIALNNEKRNVHRRNGGSYSYLAKSYCDVLALLLGQGTVTRLHQSRNILHNSLLTFILATFVLRQLFSMDITALLLSRKQLKFDYFQQLEEDGSVQIMVENGSNSHLHFVEQFPSLRPRVIPIPHQSLISVQTLRKLIHENCVLIASGRIAQYIQAEFPQLPFHNSEQAYLLSLSNFAIRKSLDQRYKLKLSKLFKSIFQFGLETKVDKSMKMENFRNSFDNVRQKSLSQVKLTTENLALHDIHDYSEQMDKDRTVQTVLSYVYIYLVGIGAAVGVFSLELICSLGKVKSFTREANSSARIVINNSDGIVSISRIRFMY